jgi:uncharacterized membrane protein YfcA
MKEMLFLIISAVILSIVGWLFWHYTGSEGVSTLTTLALIVSVIDNIRLRRRLESKQKNDTP